MDFSALPWSVLVGFIESIDASLREGAPQRLPHIPEPLEVYVSASQEKLEKVLRRLPFLQELFEQGWAKLYDSSEMMIAEGKTLKASHKRSRT